LQLSEINHNFLFQQSELSFKIYNTSPAIGAKRLLSRGNAGGKKGRKSQSQKTILVVHCNLAMRPIREESRIPIRR